MKKKNKWEKLAKAKEALQLSETASINQIKHAYRALAKTHHPDRAESSDGGQAIEMETLNRAYRTLIKHCENHPIPLEKQEGQVDDEDWWMDRFGNDPLWGRGKKEG